MSAIKGVDFLIKIKKESQFILVGGQQNGSLELGLNTIDVTDKEGNGWEEVIPGIKHWSASLDGVVKLSNEGLKLAQDALFQGKLVDVETSMGGSKYTGKALVTSLSYEGAHDDAATFSISLKGTGALTADPSQLAAAANVKEAK